MKNIKLFGMKFEIDGKYLIGESKDIDKLSYIIFAFIFLLIVLTCLIGHAIV